MPILHQIKFKTSNVDGCLRYQTVELRCVHEGHGSFLPGPTPYLWIAETITGNMNMKLCMPLLHYRVRTVKHTRSTLCKVSTFTSQAA